MAGTVTPSYSIESVRHDPTPAIRFTASSVDNLLRISSILTLATSEGGMDYWRWYVPKHDYRSALRNKE